MTTYAETVPWTEFRRDLTGTVFVPGEDGWDAARQAWNLAADQHPVAVLYAETAEDVQSAVKFARKHGLRVSAQGTGHGAGAMARMDNTLLIKTERMRNVTIDPDRRIARAEAGVVWQEVSLAAAQHGLAGLAGSSGDVGVIGYLLTGGLSWMARKFGLGVNWVTAVEIVTADGAWRRVDRANEPELFWALRGAAGSFGVVTAIEFSLFPITNVYAGTLVWPAEIAPKLFAEYKEWTSQAPQELTAIMRYLHLPPLEFLPEPVRGKPVVTLGATFVGSAEDGSKLIDQMRAIAPTTMDTFGTIPVEELRHLHMDPPQPVPAVVDHLLLTDIDDEAIETLHSVAGPGSGSRVMVVELRQLGGAVESAPEGSGAAGSFPGRFALNVIAVPFESFPLDQAYEETQQVVEAMKPWANGRQYLNFVDGDTDASTGFDSAIYRKLQALRAEWDPEELFLPAHPVKAKSGAEVAA